MTLDEFLLEEREKINRFEKMWREGNSRNPDNFPSDLESGRWDEQYLSFNGELL